MPLYDRPLNPLHRKPVTESLDVGVRSINGLLTVGRGQRLGLFAGSGVGKSMLLGMMTRYTNADVIVVGLIGERGREVQDFVSGFLNSDARRRAVVIATPADYPPLVRAHGALLATSVAGASLRIVISSIICWRNRVMDLLGWVVGRLLR